MTSAPRSAIWREQNGAATACSSATTRMPVKGSCVEFAMSSTAMGSSIRPRHSEHVLAHIGKYQVGGDGSHLIQARLAEFSFHVVLGRKSETAVRLQTDVGRLPGSVGRQELRHVGLGAAWQAGVEQAGGFPAHQVGRMNVGVRAGGGGLKAL